MIIVVDASVAIKWVVDEGDRDAAVATAAGETIVGPDFVLTEAASALWKKVRLGQLSKEQATEGLTFIRSGYHRLLASSKLLDRAFALSLAHDHPVYDCLYVACAEAENVSILTVDNRLRKIAEAVGIPLSTPGDAR